ncbi:MAG: FkbM family methyltransferase [Phycisphaerales bacterium]|nr:FkbM family methyltransferase [Phycisphaerales bacterium]
MAFQKKLQTLVLNGATKVSSALHGWLCRRWNRNTLNYWDEQYTGDTAEDHWGSPIRLHFYDLVAEALPREPATILDVGSGLGIGGRHLTDIYPEWRVEGLDISPAACHRAVIKTHEVDLRTKEIPGRYDYVLAVETLEHFSDPLKVLEKLYKAARRAVVLTVPYQGRLSTLHPVRFDADTFIEYPHVQIELTKRRYASSGSTKTDMLAVLYKEQPEAGPLERAGHRRAAVLTGFNLLDDDHRTLHELHFDRCDPYLFFASNRLPPNPIVVEVGSFKGVHACNLYNRLQGTVIVYEAGKDSYDKLRRNVSSLPITVHHAAVTGANGEVDFFEFEEISSSSIYPRHERENRKLQKRTKVRSVGLEQILKDNDLEKIDVLFTNCEGAEIDILNEVLSKPFLTKKLPQLCISFHGGRIYDQSKADELIEKMSDRYIVVKDESKWPCHLFINKDCL